MSAGPMKIQVNWQEKRRFDGTNELGHHTAMDARTTAAGDASAPTPKELVLHGLAGCTAMDVISILEKMRVPPKTLRVEVTAEQTDSHPKVFHKIHVRYVVTGEVPKDKLERAIELSATQYCGVSAMLAKTATVTHDFELTP